MALDNTLVGWQFGEPPQRDDGGLAIVLLHESVRVDGQEHYDKPMIVSRWGGKLKTTAGYHRLNYEDVWAYIDIAMESETPSNEPLPE